MLKEFLDKLSDKYHDLCFRVVYSDHRHATVEMELKSIFRKFRRPVSFLIIDSEQDDSLSDILEDYLMKNSSRTDLFPILLTPSKTLKRIYSQIASTNFFANSQPIINIDSLLRTGGQAEVLRDVLLSSASSSLLSPYRIDAYASQSMFFGRDKIVNDLIRTSGNHVLTGPRRIGKTSVVKRIQSDLGPLRSQYSGFKRLDNNIRKCCYVDVSSLGTENIQNRLWGAILAAFHVDFRTIEVLGRRTRVTVSRRSVPDEFKALETLIELHPRQLTLVLDEVDNWFIHEAAREWETVERLRSITDGGKANIILVGYESFLLESMNPRFPLKGRGETFFLGPLDNEAIDQLVLTPLAELKIRLLPERDIMERIWQEASGLPHLTQGICSHLVDIAFGKRKGKAEEVTLGHNELSAAINRTGVLEQYQEDVDQWDFPLAEAIAGILALSSRIGNHVGLSNIGILTELENHYSYKFDDREFRLALKHLELRFVIKCLDQTRTTWEWINQGTRKRMETRIEKTGYERWRKSVSERHISGSWRSNYPVLNR